MVNISVVFILFWGVKLSLFVKQSLSLQTVTELTNSDFKIMAFTSNIMIVRHRLLKELVKLWNNNELVDKIDRLPIELVRRGQTHGTLLCAQRARGVEVQVIATAGTRYGGRDG